MEYIKFGLKSYGVEIGFDTNDAEILDQLLKGIASVLPDGFETLDPEGIKCLYRVKKNRNGFFEFYINGKLEACNDSIDGFFAYFLSLVRLRVAEHAVSRVFVHAGAVVWKGKAIVFPARSFQGKTTIVRELILLGAEYLSDEYAVLDDKGMVHPFPKTLSVRGIAGDYAQTEVPAEDFGALTAKGAYEAGLVIFTEFEAGAVWSPEILSPGKGMLEIISHTIPIRYNPKFSLQVLNKILNRAIIAKSKRGDSKDFAKTLLEFFENRLN